VLTVAGRQRWFMVKGFSRQVWRIRWQVGGWGPECFLLVEGGKSY